MKVIKIVASIFFSIGIILLLVAYWQFNEIKKFTEKSAIAKGTVKDLFLNSGGSSGGAYFPVIRFKTATGETIDFKSDIGSRPPSYKKGDQVQVRYDPNNPYLAKIDSFLSIWAFCIIPAGLGIFCSGIGLLVFIYIIHLAKRDAWLQKYGQLISAEFQSVEIDKSKVNKGRSPYRIVAHWRDPLTNKLYVFKSKEIWSDPTAFMENRDILVRIDPQNPKKYLMDISFIPEIEK